MQIIAVLNARSKMTDDEREARGAEVAEWWPSGVTAISFVITKPDAAEERFLVHAIDAGEEGRGLYSLEVPGDQLPILLGVLGRVIEQVSLSVPVPPPPPPPIHPPVLLDEFRQVRVPGRHHPAVALAMLQQQAILRMQEIQNHPRSHTPW